MTGSQVDPHPAPSVEQRLDMLMQMLCGLHEAEVITDPAVSASKTDEGTAVTVEFLLDSPRVAVVRPTDDATTPQNADSWWAEKCWRCGCRRDDHAQDGSCYTESDEKFVGSEAAVVRPTRDADRDRIIDVIFDNLGVKADGPWEMLRRAEAAADALLAEFWPGTPE